MEPGKVNNENNQRDQLVTGNKVDEPIKKEPDEEKPSILGTEPDLLEVPPAEEDKAFTHLKDEEGLLDEDGKVDDGLI